MEDGVRDALHAYVRTGEPPMSISAAGLLRAGRSRRRWRISLLTGGSAALVAVTITGTLVLNPAGGAGTPEPPAPMSAAEILAGCTVPPADPARSPVAPSSPGTQVGRMPLKQAPDPTSDFDPVLAARMSCFLADHLTTTLPDAGYLPLYGPLPLVFYRGGEAPYAANAQIVDELGTSSLILAVHPQTEEPPSQESLDSKGFTRRTGPHGEFIQVSESVSPQGQSDAGVIVTNIYVFTGATQVVASITNTNDRMDSNGAGVLARPTPALTLDQLIALACAAELTIFD
jgi:hypothetical protein